MRQTLISFLAIFSFVVVAVCADGPRAGGINLQSVPLEKVLALYQDLSGGQLIQSSEVKRMHPAITVHPAQTLSKADTLKAVEMALVEQAGVVITPLDDHRISVTFNDALPVHAVNN